MPTRMGPTRTWAKNSPDDPFYVEGTLPANEIIAQDKFTIAARILDTETQVAHGILDGFAIVNKYGVDRDIDTSTTPEDVWGGSGIYTGFPDQVETIQAFSTSADDNFTGTGARILRLIGLDTNWNPASVDINLNGTAPVNSATQFRRVHTGFIIAAGSGGVNAGEITVRHTTTTANVFLVMVIGRNQTNNAGYTIPAGFTGYMRRLMIEPRISTSSGTGSIEGAIWTRTFGQVFRARRPFFLSSNTEYADAIYGGLVFTEKTDLTIRIFSVSDNNSIVSAAYDMLLVRNVA